ncbi:MAG: CDP-glucose 4,6-dehydratase [Bacteroidia bacterium]|nr:CDP-glucose 4,6-dehydratase [Bacteroidia bacterium]
MGKMVKETLFGDFYKGRKVFITGHTGFKGSWLSIFLHWLGADVYGYALKPHTIPSLYELAKVDQLVTSTVGDVRDYNFLLRTLKEVQPEVIIHMAAQAIVMESYKNPRETYEINVMGTVNLLDAVRQVESVKAILNITTDKCYENKEWHWGYRENEPMGGYDPYSNSKGCSELVTSSFRNSFFNSKEYKNHGVSLASARAGNVIGGGDWAENRLIPDFIRAIMHGEKLKIRSPYSIRPWQHVLEPLSGYLMLCEKLYTAGTAFAEGWNFGPDDSDAKNVEWITKKICELWGDGASFEIDTNPQPHEANYLKLDCSKAKAELGWAPKWDIETTLKYIVDWNKAWLNKENIRSVSEEQIEEYYK